MGDERRRPSSILLVDDDPVLRSALARILEGEGHEVIEAADGPSAIDAAKAQRPDLLLLDYMMPGMNGAMLLASIHEALAERTPPAVLLTASGDHLERARDMGAVLGLEKPFNVRELLAVVQRYLDQTRDDAS